MKKILLFLFLTCFMYNTYSQVVCAGVSPAAIAGNYDFTWGEPANNWSSPDFSLPGTYVSGDLMLADDGTPGINPVSGVPLAHYGCPPLINDLSGKICLIYRYDGITPSTLCFLYDKAINAQNAGAIAVLIVNRPDGPEDVGGGGTVGPNVTIPVVMVSFTDGEILRAEMNNGPVTMFLGNKTGLFLDDVGLTSSTNLIPKSYGVISRLSENASEYNFELGTRVYNYGTNNQSSVTITANINDPSGASVYNSVAGPIAILSGDSADVFPGEVFSFPTFSLANYPLGKYTLSYTASLGVSDGYTGDNTISANFIMNDTVFSYSKLDSISMLPIPSNGYRPSVGSASYSTCMVINDPNASRIGVAGIYFSASSAYGSGIELTGEEMALFLYQWEDNFVDLNDAGLAFDNLTAIAYGYYNYTSDLQSQTVYGEFLTPVTLEDNQRFLACVQTYNAGIYLGHDKKTNYTWNEAFYLQPIAPNESDGTYYASGFGMDIPSSMALRVFDASELTLDESSLIEGIVYPNPASESIILSLHAEGSGVLTISDLSGKIYKEVQTSLVNGKSEVNICNMEAGIYILKFTFENGKSSQFRVVKR